MAVLGALASDFLGTATGGLADIWGGNKAARALKNANLRARSDLSQGYEQGKGFQQPIYDTSLGQYTDLAGDYNAGKFNNPHMDPYKFDPQSVFQDPEYQAQMRAGTNAINTGAQGKGTLFSGANDRDLTQFGQDIFANRSDALYNRGFNAQNTAFNQNLAGSGQNFNQGLQLTQPLGAAAGNLTDLSLGQGEALAGNDLMAGAIRAGNIQNTAGALGGIAQKAGSTGYNYLGRGK